MKSLKHQAASGAKWTTTSTVITTGLQFLELTILARILLPQDFGLMAMIMVVVGFAQAYADMGISSAIIHRQDATAEQLSSLYWLNIMAGTVVFLLVNALTPLIVTFYSEPKLNSLLPFSTLIFLITPFGQQFQILLQKELSFKTLAIIEITSSSIGFIVAVGFALAGAGVFSIIAGQLGVGITKAMSLLTLGIRRWRPTMRFKTSDLKGYIGFGIYQMGDKSITYINSNLDNLLIGSLLGSQSLGYYSLAANLVLRPVSKINPIITRVAFPVFARIQSDDEPLQKAYLSVLRILTSINFPLLVGISATAPVLMPVLFGEAWSPTVVLIQILSLVSLLRSQANPVGSLLMAKGRADLAFRWNLMLTITQAPGVYFGAKMGGTQGVALALLALQLFYFYPFYVVLIKPMIHCTLWQYLASMHKALISALAMGGGVVLIPYIFEAQAKLLLAAQILLGVLIYCILLCLLNKTYFAKTFGLLFKRNQGSDPEASS